MKRRAAVIFWILSFAFCVSLAEGQVHDGDTLTYTVTIITGIDSGTDVSASVYEPGNFPTTAETTITMSQVSGDSVWYLTWPIPTNAEHGLWLIKGEYVYDSDTLPIAALYDFVVTDLAEAGYSTADEIVQITVCDTTDSSGISGFTVSLYESGDTDYSNRLAKTYTNGFGVAEFHMAPGSYLAHFFHPPWSEDDRSIVVADTGVLQTWTVYASISTSTNLVHIYGWVRTLDDDAASSPTVEITLDTRQMVWYDSDAYKKSPWADKLTPSVSSTTGYWEAYVPPSNGFYTRSGTVWSSASVQYVLKSYGSNVPSRQSKITLPDTENFQW